MPNDFAKETKMVHIRGTEIFMSMSGIHFKREAMSSRNKSNLRLYVFQPYTKKAWSKSFGINSIGNESFGCSEVKGSSVKGSNGITTRSPTSTLSRWSIFVLTVTSSTSSSP